MPVMQTADDTDTELLLRRAEDGDAAACGRLLARHQERLRRLVGFRLDRRLAARIDPSDVVQDALANAARNLGGYLRDRPLPFYPWLRQIALERLVELHRRHVVAQKRSVTREEANALRLNDESTLELTRRLVAAGGPVQCVIQEELRERVRAALGGLPPRDREVLVLRHLDQLTTREIAAVLGVSDGAVKVRHLRALQRFRALLREGGNEESL
jgi:RNA polymerase sigma-70 factor, ECF subfamily